MTCSKKVNYLFRKYDFSFENMIFPKSSCVEYMICLLKDIIPPKKGFEIVTLRQNRSLNCAPEPRWGTPEPRPLGHLPRNAGRGHGRAQYTDIYIYIYVYILMLKNV